MVVDVEAMLSGFVVIETLKNVTPWQRRSS